MTRPSLPSDLTVSACLPRIRAKPPAWRRWEVPRWLDAVEVCVESARGRLRALDGRLALDLRSPANSIQPSGSGISIWSAGGVVLRKAESGEWEVVLCRRESEDLWALPKGTPSSNEGIAETALREVREETGLEVEIEAPLGAIRYSFVRQSSDALRYPDVRPGEPVLFDKEVHFFLMRPVGGSLSLHDKEFDEVRWVRVSAARSKLTHENEARIVEKAVALSEGPSRGQARHQNRG